MIIDSYTAIFAADVHMNNNLPHARPSKNGRTDRLDDQIKLWKRFGHIAEKTKAKDFWLLGDLFDHGKVDAVTLAETAKAMAGYPGNVLIVPGNHDAHTIHGGRFNVEAFGHLCSNIRYIGGRIPTPIQPVPWLVFWPVEFMPLEETEKTLQDIRERIRDGLPKVKGERVDVLLIHNSVTDCSHAGWVCDSGLVSDDLCQGFDYVIAGHFHDTQTFGPDGAGMYLGAPMHHRYDDMGRKSGFWAITFEEGGGITKKFFNGRAPAFHEEEYKGYDTEDLSRFRPDDYLRVKVTATHSKWITMKSEVLEAVDWLKSQGLRASFVHKPIYHHTTRIKSHGDMDSVSMEKNLVAYLKSGDVDTSGLDVSRLKKIGTEALSVCKGKLI